MPRKAKVTNPEPCPNCGHCPTCGHTPQRMAPLHTWYPTWYPVPYYPNPWFGVVPPSPYTTIGWTLTTDSTTLGSETTTAWYKLDNGAGGTC